jgi:nitroreductase
MVLVFVADCHKWPATYEVAGAYPRRPGVGDLMLAVEDAAIAAQNAVTAAWSYGLGSCYIGDVMERCDETRDLLHLPEHVFPAVMLVLGYPTAQQKARVGTGMTRSSRTARRPDAGACVPRAVRVLTLRPLAVRCTTCPTLQPEKAEVRLASELGQHSLVY